MTLEGKPNPIELPEDIYPDEIMPGNPEER